jgi:hypothetical protein
VSGGSFEVLKSQKDFASRAVPHAQRIRPPIEVVVAHYWKKVVPLTLPCPPGSAAKLR